MFLTPNQSIEAREQLNLSQAMVAQETEINRSYLSQFESSKRVLEDPLREKLTRYYTERGWKPSTNFTAKQMLNSDNHQLTLKDGIMVSAQLPEKMQEDLLNEMYELETEIETRLAKSAPRLLFGGLDEEDCVRYSIRPILLMCRQREIVKILQGRVTGPYSDSDGKNPKSINTIGDYVEALMKSAVPDRFPEEISKSA